MSSFRKKITVRLAAGELEEIRSVARRLGMTVNDFVLAQALLQARGGTTLDRITERMDALETSLAGALDARDETLLQAIEGLRAGTRSDLEKVVRWLERRWPSTNKIES